MGLFDFLKKDQKPSLEELLATTRQAGNALAVALNKAGRGEPFKGMVFTGGKNPELVYCDSEAAVNDWVNQYALKVPWYSSAVAIVDQGKPALRVVAVDTRGAPTRIVMVARYTPQGQEGGFALDSDMRFEGIVEGHGARFASAFNDGVVAIDVIHDLFGGVPAKAPPVAPPVADTSIEKDPVFDAVQYAGSGIALALERIGYAKPFVAFVLTEGRTDFDKVTEAEEWVERHGAKEPLLVLVRATTRHGRPAISARATMKKPAAWANLVVPYEPRADGQPFSLDLDAIEFTGSRSDAPRELLLTAFAMGTANIPAAMPLLAPEPNRPDTAESLPVPAELKPRFAAALRNMQKLIAHLPEPEGGRIEVSQDTGRLTVLDREKRQAASARFQFVAIYSTQTGALTWAWGNDNADQRLRAGSLTVKELGEALRVRSLMEHRHQCGPNEALAHVAFALELMKAQSWARVPISAHADSYLALYDIQLGEHR